MIKDFSDLDLKLGSVYGMRPLLDFQKTCYFNVCFLKIFIFCPILYILRFCFNRLLLLSKVLRHLMIFLSCLNLKKFVVVMYMIF